MRPRWILSQCHLDDDGHVIPVAADYGGRWMCPVTPESTDALVLTQVYVNDHQIDAMKEDDRLLVCPLLFDPRPAPAEVITAYASMGATADMSLAVLLATLADTIPHFGHTI